MIHRIPSHSPLSRAFLKSRCFTFFSPPPSPREESCFKQNFNPSTTFTPRAIPRLSRYESVSRLFKLDRANRLRRFVEDAFRCCTRILSLASSLENKRFPCEKAKIITEPTTDNRICLLFDRFYRRSRRAERKIRGDKKKERVSSRSNDENRKTVHEHVGGHLRLSEPRAKIEEDSPERRRGGRRCGSNKIQRRPAGRVIETRNATDYGGNMCASLGDIHRTSYIEASAMSNIYGATTVLANCHRER